jgi:hypothetical protein
MSGGHGGVPLEKFKVLMDAQDRQRAQKAVHAKKRSAATIARWLS